jgi:S1-C subfamily serine protease
VVTGGRAIAAGLRTGDVILEVNGRDVGDAADFEEQVRALPPEVLLTLRVWRDRRAIELTLTRSSRETP